MTPRDKIEALQKFRLSKQQVLKLMDTAASRLDKNPHANWRYKVLLKAARAVINTFMPANMFPYYWREFSRVIMEIEAANDMANAAEDSGSADVMMLAKMKMERLPDEVFAVPGETKIAPQPVLNDTKALLTKDLFKFGSLKEQ